MALGGDTTPERTVDRRLLSQYKSLSVTRVFASSEEVARYFYPQDHFQGKVEGNRLCRP